MLLRAHSAEHVERVRDRRAGFRCGFARPSGHLRACRPGIRRGGESRAQRAARREELQPDASAGSSRDARTRRWDFATSATSPSPLSTRSTNGAERVAIWDFDAHHGNGTEEIVANNPQIAFASIHQSPGYPGHRSAFVREHHNFPVAPAHAARAATWSKSNGRSALLVAFKPDLLLVSAGLRCLRRRPDHRDDTVDGRFRHLRAMAARDRPPRAAQFWKAATATICRN